MKRADFKAMAGLQLLLLFYSLSSVLSKAAAQAGSPWGFALFYGGVLLILCLYALGWQQCIKKLPLSTAYANKAMVIVWGMLWGTMLFHEPLHWGKPAGAALIIAGIVLFSREGGAPHD